MALRAKEAFTAFQRDGVMRTMAPGALVADDDEIVKGREHLFEPVEAAIARFGRSEQATAAPGEKRGRVTRRAARKAAASPAEKRGNGRRRATAKAPAEQEEPASDETPEETPTGDEQTGEAGDTQPDAAGDSQD